MYSTYMCSIVLTKCGDLSSDPSEVLTDCLCLDGGDGADAALPPAAPLVFLP